MHLIRRNNWLDQVGYRHFAVQGVRESISASGNVGRRTRCTHGGSRWRSVRQLRRNRRPRLDESQDRRETHETVPTDFPAASFEFDSTRALVLISVLAAAAAVAASAVRAAAFAITDVQTFKFVDFPVTNPCNGETVVLNGTTTIVWHATADASGGLHGAAATANGPVAQIAGGGIGSLTGDSYRFSVVSFLDGNYEPGFPDLDRAGTFTSHVRTLIVSMGAASNFALDFIFKQTVTPSGEQTAFLAEVIYSECRGGGPPIPTAP
jgi:hypothetical protein